MSAEILQTPSSGSTAQNTRGNWMYKVTDVGKTGGKQSLNVRWINNGSYLPLLSSSPSLLSSLFL